MQFKESEEKLEQGVEDKLGQAAAAAGDAAKTVGMNGNVLSGYASIKLTTQLLLDWLIAVV